MTDQRFGLTAYFYKPYRLYLYTTFMILVRRILALPSLPVLMAFCQTAEPPAPGVPRLPLPPVVAYTFEEKPIWADEFDYTGLPDSKRWSYDVGGNGWGNNELQFYTKERAENA